MENELEGMELSEQQQEEAVGGAHPKRSRREKDWICRKCGARFTSTNSNAAMNRKGCPVCGGHDFYL